MVPQELYESTSPSLVFDLVLLKSVLVNGETFRSALLYHVLNSLGQQDLNASVHGLTLFGKSWSKGCVRLAAFDFLFFEVRPGPKRSLNEEINKI